MIAVVVFFYLVKWFLLILFSFHAETKEKVEEVMPKLSKKELKKMKKHVRNLPFYHFTLGMVSCNSKLCANSFFSGFLLTDQLLQKFKCSVLICVLLLFSIINVCFCFVFFILFPLFLSHSFFLPLSHYNRWKFKGLYIFLCKHLIYNFLFFKSWNFRNSLLKKVTFASLQCHKLKNLLKLVPSLTTNKTSR